MGGAYPKTIEQPAVGTQGIAESPAGHAKPSGVAVMGVPHLSDQPSEPRPARLAATPIPGIDFGIQEGIEIHEANGEIHFHDRHSPDKLKVAHPVAGFWAAWKEFIRQPVNGPPLIIVDEQRSTMVTLQKAYGYAGPEPTIDIKMTINRVNFGDNWKHISNFVSQR